MRYRDCQRGIFGEPRRDHLSKADAITVTAVETGVPALERFLGMLRARDTDALAPSKGRRTSAISAQCAVPWPVPTPYSLATASMPLPART